LALGVIAIAGLPPFGIFLSEFMLVTSTFARAPLLAVILVAGLLIAFAALLLRLQQILFGEPSGPAGAFSGKVGTGFPKENATSIESSPDTASYVPLFVHVAFVSMAGLWLPDAIVRWFRVVAAQLG